MPDPLARIIENIPKDFFKSLQEQMDTAFAEASYSAAEHIDEPERLNMLGQLRHARCEVGFRNAARTAWDFRPVHSIPNRRAVDIAWSKAAASIYSGPMFKLIAAHPARPVFEENGRVLIDG